MLTIKRFLDHYAVALFFYLDARLGAIVQTVAGFKNELQKLQGEFVVFVLERFGMRDEYVSTEPDLFQSRIDAPSYNHMVQI